MSCHIALTDDFSAIYFAELVQYEDYEGRLCCNIKYIKRDAPLCKGS